MQKTIDFEGSVLFSDEAIHVQVKAAVAKSSQSEPALKELAKVDGRAILVANVDRREFGEPEKVELVDRLDLANYCVEYGLTDWVVRKAG